MLSQIETAFWIISWNDTYTTKHGTEVLAFLFEGIYFFPSLPLTVWLESYGIWAMGMNQWNIYYGILWYEYRRKWNSKECTVSRFYNVIWIYKLLIISCKTFDGLPFQAWKHRNRNLSLRFFLQTLNNMHKHRHLSMFGFQEKNYIRVNSSIVWLFLVDDISQTSDFKALLYTVVQINGSRWYFSLFSEGLCFRLFSSVGCNIQAHS